MFGAIFYVYKKEVQKMSDLIELKLITREDAECLHKLQIEAFMPLYEKYQDDATSPAKESLETITKKIVDDNSDFYFILFNGKRVGGVIERLFEVYSSDTIEWRLDTIKQEEKNCYLYEKCGFVRVGNETVINEKMTLVEYTKTCKKS